MRTGKKKRQRGAGKMESRLEKVDRCRSAGRRRL